MASVPEREKERERELKHQDIGMRLWEDGQGEEKYMKSGGDPNGAATSQGMPLTFSFWTSGLPNWMRKFVTAATGNEHTYCWKVLGGMALSLPLTVSAAQRTTCPLI